MMAEDKEWLVDDLTEESDVWLPSESESDENSLAKKRKKQVNKRKL